MAPCRVLACAAALVLLLCGAAFAAKSKATQTPEFSELPFSFSGAGNAASGVPVNEQLVFLNGTKGFTGALQVTLQVTAGAVALQACQNEICFRHTTNGRHTPYVASREVLTSGQPWLLVAGGEASDDSSWWFWLSNQDGTSKASGTLRVALLPTVVLGNDTENSVEVALGAGEFRLFQVPAHVDAGAVLQVSFVEATSPGSFQVFPPSDSVLPSVELQMTTPSYYADSYDGNQRLQNDQSSPLSPTAPLDTRFEAVAFNAGTDNVVWWLVAGSRNQQAVNATLTVTLTPTVPLTSGQATNVTVPFSSLGRSGTQVARLSAAAGQTGAISTLSRYNTSAVQVLVAAGVFYDGMSQSDDAETEYFIASPMSDSGVETGSRGCHWNDETDWWVLVRPVSAIAQSEPVQLQLGYVATRSPAADGSLAINTTANFVTLVKVPGVAGSAALRIQSPLDDTTTSWNQAYIAINSGFSSASTLDTPHALHALPGAICDASLNQPTSNISLDSLNLAIAEGYDWFVVIVHAGPEVAGTLNFFQIPTTPLPATGTATTVSLMGTAVSYEHDVAVLRVDPAAGATGAFGLDLSLTFRRGAGGLYPGQNASVTNIPPYTNILQAFVAHDYVTPTAWALFGAPAAPIVYLPMDNYVCDGDCAANLNSTKQASVSTTTRFWADQYALSATLPLIPAANVTAALRRALATGGAVAGAQLAAAARVANDAQRPWYVVLSVDVYRLFNPEESTVWTGAPFTLPIDVTASWAPVIDIASGAPVLSPPSPSTGTPRFSDVNAPAYATQLYRIRGSPGASGLASVTTAASAGTMSLFVSPGARTIGTKMYNTSGCEKTPAVGRSLSACIPPRLQPSRARVVSSALISGGGSTYYQLLQGQSADSKLQNQWDNFYRSESAQYALEFQGFFDVTDHAAFTVPNSSPARTLYLTSPAVKTAWLQAADNADDVDWYVTAITFADQPAFSFTVTLHSTVPLLDSATDDFGALRWTASGVPVAYASQYLFKLPARFTLRGIISDVSVVADDGTSFGAQDRLSPLALTLQSQTIPSPRAGLGDAYWGPTAFTAEENGYYFAAGTTFSLPFAPTSPSPITVGGVAAYPALPNGYNNDFSDVYLLGVSRVNQSQRTTVIDLQVTVGQTLALCNKKITCSNKGKCLSDGSCDCDSGYGGQFCSCKDSRDCSGHGICALTQGCVCDEGFSGADCSRSAASSLVVSAALALALALLAALLM